MLEDVGLSEHAGRAGRLENWCRQLPAISSAPRRGGKLQHRNCGCSTSEKDLYMWELLTLLRPHPPSPPARPPSVHPLSCSRTPAPSEQQSRALPLQEAPRGLMIGE